MGSNNTGELTPQEILDLTAESDKGLDLESPEQSFSPPSDSSGPPQVSGSGFSDKLMGGVHQAMAPFSGPKGLSDIAFQGVLGVMNNTGMIPNAPPGSRGAQLSDTAAHPVQPTIGGQLRAMGSEAKDVLKGSIPGLAGPPGPSSGGGGRLIAATLRNPQINPGIATMAAGVDELAAHLKRASDEFQKRGEPDKARYAEAARQMLVNGETTAEEVISDPLLFSGALKSVLGKGVEAAGSVFGKAIPGLETAGNLVGKYAHAVGLPGLGAQAAEATGRAVGGGVGALEGGDPAVAGQGLLDIGTQAALLSQSSPKDYVKSMTTLKPPPSLDDRIARVTNKEDIDAAQSFNEKLAKVPGVAGHTKLMKGATAYASKGWLQSLLGKTAVDPRATKMVVDAILETNDPAQQVSSNDLVKKLKAEGKPLTHVDIVAALELLQKNGFLSPLSADASKGPGEGSFLIRHHGEWGKLVPALTEAVRPPENPTEHFMETGRPLPVDVEIPGKTPDATPPPVTPATLTPEEQASTMKRGQASEFTPTLDEPPLGKPTLAPLSRAKGFVENQAKMRAGPQEPPPPPEAIGPPGLEPPSVPPLPEPPIGPPPQPPPPPAPTSGSGTPPPPPPLPPTAPPAATSGVPPLPPPPVAKGAAPAVPPPVEPAPSMEQKGPMEQGPPTPASARYKQWIADNPELVAQLRALGPEKAKKSDLLKDVKNSVTKGHILREVFKEPSLPEPPVPPEEGSGPKDPSSTDDGPLVDKAIVNGKIVSGTDSNLETTIGSQSGTGNVASATVRELVQNAIDSVRGATRKNVHVALDTDEGKIIVQDSGSGMTPEILATKAIDLGGSAKGDVGAGRFGIGKGHVFKNAKKVTITTTFEKDGKLYDTGISIDKPNEGYLNKEWLPTHGIDSEGMPLAVPSKAKKTGTKVEVELPDDTKDDLSASYRKRAELRENLQDLVKYSTHGADVSGTLSEGSWTAKSFGRKAAGPLLEEAQAFIKEHLPAAVEASRAKKAKGVWANKYGDVTYSKGNILNNLQLIEYHSYENPAIGERAGQLRSKLQDMNRSIINNKQGKAQLELVHQVTLPSGIKGEFYQEPHASATDAQRSSGYIRLIVSNEGIPQYSDTMYVAGDAGSLPKTVVLDVTDRSGVKTNHTDYPWSLDRTSLRGPMETEVAKFFKSYREKAANAERDALRDALRQGGPKLEHGGEFLAWDGSLSRESADQIHATHAPVLNEFNRLAKLVYSTFSSFTSATQGSLYKEGKTNTEWGGISAGEGDLGVNINAKTVLENAKRRIYINPFNMLKEPLVIESAAVGTGTRGKSKALSGLVMATVAHEFAHSTHPDMAGHGERFAGGLTRIANSLPPETEMALKKQLTTWLDKNLPALEAAGKDIDGARTSKESRKGLGKITEQSAKSGSSSGGLGRQTPLRQGSEGFQSSQRNPGASGGKGLALGTGTQGKRLGVGQAGGGPKEPSSRQLPENKGNGQKGMATKLSLPSQLKPPPL